MRLVHRAPWLRPWLGPVGSRPVGLYHRPLQQSDIQAGAWVLAKARAVEDDFLGRTLQTPFELCRVTETPAEPTEDMDICVEFLFADRQAKHYHAFFNCLK